MLLAVAAFVVAVSPDDEEMSWQQDLLVFPPPFLLMAEVFMKGISASHRDRKRVFFRPLSRRSLLKGFGRI